MASRLYANEDELLEQTEKFELSHVWGNLPIRSYIEAV